MPENFDVSSAYIAYLNGGAEMTEREEIAEWAANICRVTKETNDEE